MKILGCFVQLMPAKLVSLQYCGEVYSNALCWTVAEQAVLFRVISHFNPLLLGPPCIINLPHMHAKPQRANVSHYRKH